MISLPPTTLAFRYVLVQDPASDPRIIKFLSLITDPGNRILDRLFAFRGPEKLFSRRSLNVMHDDVNFCGRRKALFIGGFLHGNAFVKFEFRK